MFQEANPAKADTLCTFPPHIFVWLMGASSCANIGEGLIFSRGSVLVSGAAAHPAALARSCTYHSFLKCGSWPEAIASPGDSALHTHLTSGLRPVLEFHCALQMVPTPIVPAADLKNPILPFHAVTTALASSSQFSPNWSCLIGFLALSSYSPRKHICFS